MRKGNHGGDWAAYQAKHDALPRLDFSANVSPLGPPEGVKRAMREAIEHVAQYPDPRCCALRKALGEHHGVDPAHILCGNGAADLIDRLALALRPKRALVTAPTFSEYAEALERVGGQVISFPLREEHSFAVTPEILDAITPDLDVLFLCEPNNPTGRTTAPGLLQAILEKGRACGVLVVLDEGYITNVAVRPECRRNGIAQKLLQVFLDFAQAHKLAFLTLEVRASNYGAIALYGSRGFRSVGRRKNYYEHPKEDAIIMTKEFTDGTEDPDTGAAADGL